MLDPINHRYYLGYSIDQIISDPLTTHEYLRTCAFKPMTTLADNTEETIILCVSVGLQYIILSEIPKQAWLRVYDGKKGEASCMPELHPEFYSPSLALAIWKSL